MKDLLSDKAARRQVGGGDDDNITTTADISSIDDDIIAITEISSEEEEGDESDDVTIVEPVKKKVRIEAEDNRAAVNRPEGGEDISQTRTSLQSKKSRVEVRSVIHQMPF